MSNERVTGVRIATGVREELNEFAAQAWRDGIVEHFADIREEPVGATKHPDADCPDPCPYCAAWRAERAARAEGARLEARAHLARVALSTVAPGSLIEIASGHVGLVLDGTPGHAQRSLAWVTSGYVDTLPSNWTVSLRATPAELDALTSADATEAQDEIVAALKALGARPDLTLGEAIARFKARRASSPGLSEEQADAIATDIERALPEGGRLSRSDFTAAIKGAILRASRAETGPAEPFEKIEQLPSGLTRAQRASMPPASALGEWPEPERSGLTCPGCYAATGIAQPHDPRVTPATPWVKDAAFPGCEVQREGPEVVGVRSPNWATKKEDDR